MPSDSSTPERNVWRPLFYGGCAGATLGLLLVLTGLTSVKPALCVVQFVSIMCFGIGCGLVIGCCPRTMLETEGLRARIFTGLLTGLLVGPAAVAIAGFIVGGCTRMNMWRHNAPDFLSGAECGAILCTLGLGLPAIVVGPLIGAVFAVVLNHWQSPRWVVVGATTAAVTLLMVWIWTVSMMVGHF